MSWTNWVARWEASLQACNLIGGEARDLNISGPAVENDVRAIERVGIDLPVEFRQVLLEFSASLAFSWFLPDTELPTEFREISRGNCSWDLAKLVEMEESRCSWIQACFPNPEDSYDVVWHNKLAFLEVGNGDLLALDLNYLPNAPVMYLSHDGGEGHGYRLGDNFVDFIDRWSLLGCPGAEDWQMMPFISSPTSGLEPHSENARKWREWFGLKV